MLAPRWRGVRYDISRQSGVRHTFEPLPFLASAFRSPDPPASEETPPSFREFRLRPIRSYSTQLVYTALLSLIFVCLCVAPAAAESGWVRGAPLNLRTGAGVQYKIVGTAKPGDRMEVIGRSDGWTQVRTAAGKTGWIAAGYLDPQPPPALRLEQLETETGVLRTQLEEIRSEAAQLRESNATLASTDSGQREQIESLKIENYELRAGSRYQEWVTGALILAGGMLLGAFLHRNSTRRPSSRIRL